MDYISREDAVTEIVKMSMSLMSVPEEDNIDDRGSFSDGLFLATNVINGMPAVDVVKRKVGKWVKDSYGNIECSLCGTYASQTMTGCLMNRHLDFYKTNYCPNCGADMRKDE